MDKTCLRNEVSSGIPGKITGSEKKAIHQLSISDVKMLLLNIGKA